MSDDRNKVYADIKKGVPYVNHVETSGSYASTILSYGAAKNGRLRMQRHVIFPNLRKYPNDTFSALSHNFKGVKVYCNGRLVREKVSRVEFNGQVIIRTVGKGLSIEHRLFTATDEPCLAERLKITNLEVGCANIKIKLLDKSKITSKITGHENKQYRLYTDCGTREFSLNNFGICYAEIAYIGCKTGETVRVPRIKELKKAREKLVKTTAETLVIETPERKINVMTAFAKLRLCESIFKTKSGLMHSPGGGGYYAALWTNDQCEYANPLFGYLGYDLGVAESLNCYKLYQKYISTDKPLITSIIAGGDGFWNGAGDRGDSAMYAYGAARFLLSLGDREEASKLMPSIRDCLTFTLSQINEHGVVNSDSDELENRFESGSANLSTSCIVYDALLSAAYLEDEFGNIKEAEEYRGDAEKLKTAVENYFGATVEGYDTYRYCQEETNLRSWICMPLAMGLVKKEDGSRAENTVKALLSDKLLNGVGLVTRSGETTFWDRSTLYALRGMFSAGFADEALELLEKYVDARLLGAHVPYPVEAYPENNQAQLSAESALFLRIFTEGVLGYRPTGFGKYTLDPHLPSKWSEFKVSKILNCGKYIDITVKRLPDGGYDVV